MIILKTFHSTRCQFVRLLSQDPVGRPVTSSANQTWLLTVTLIFNIRRTLNYLYYLMDMGVCDFIRAHPASTIPWMTSRCFSADNTWTRRLIYTKIAIDINDQESIIKTKINWRIVLMLIILAFHLSTTSHHSTTYPQILVQIHHSVCKINVSHNLKWLDWTCPR